MTIIKQVTCERNAFLLRRT